MLFLIVLPIKLKFFIVLCVFMFISIWDSRKDARKMHGVLGCRIKFDLMDGGVYWSKPIFLRGAGVEVKSSTFAANSASDSFMASICAPTNSFVSF